jgi:hypothetical protein
VLGFQVHHHHAHPDGQQREDVVKADRQGELETRQQDDIHQREPLPGLTNSNTLEVSESMVSESRAQT